MEEESSIYTPEPTQRPVPIPIQDVPSSSSYNIAFYSSIIFLFCILSYAAVSYSRDVQNRQQRSTKHNLIGYNEYAMNLAKNHPNGHTSVKQEEEPEEKPKRKHRHRHSRSKRE